MLSTSAEAGPTRHGEKKKRMRCCGGGGGGVVASPAEPSTMAVSSQVRVGRPPDIYARRSICHCHTLILRFVSFLVFIYAHEVFVVLPYEGPHVCMYQSGCDFSLLCAGCIEEIQILMLHVLFAVVLNRLGTES
jgi:hypothetical protein